MKALITPKRTLQAHHKNFELQDDPQVMVLSNLMKHCVFFVFKFVALLHFDLRIQTWPMKNKNQAMLTSFILTTTLILHLSKLLVMFMISL